MEQGKHPAQHLVPQSINSPVTSLREQPLSTIQTAIRSPGDEGATLARVNAVLALYYVPDSDPETQAAVRQEFATALRGKPKWAVQRAFDAWARSQTRRPTPGEISILIDRELKPLADEISRREKLASDRAEEIAAANAARCSPEAAARIMAEAGMTPERIAAVMRLPMARSLDAAQDATAPKPLVDWTDGLSPDDPRMVQLRASRAASVVM